MNCLTNFIGISRSCGGVAPTSDLYIDMLEGMSLKTISNIEAGKYVTAQRLIDSKLILIMEKMKVDFAEFLFGDMVEDSIDSVISKNFGEDYETGEAGSAGLLIEKLPTSLSSLFIPRFYFKSHTAAVNLPITVSDASRTETFLVSANADEEVAIAINWYSNQNSVSIKFDDSTFGPSQELISPYNGAISPFHAWYYDGCTKCCAGGSRYIQISGIDYDGSEISNYRGIRVDASVICDTDKMVCLIAHKMKVPILYKIGIEVLNEWAATDRLDFLAISSREWAEQKKSEWFDTVERSQFNNGKGIRKLLMKHEQQCFICNGVSYQYSTP